MINDKMIRLIVDDSDFIDKVEKSIKNILDDGKVDELDIPEFIFLIMETYNSLPEAKLTKKEIPEFISCIFNYLVEKYNLIPLEEQRFKYEKMLVSSIKLVLMVPQFKNLKICSCW
jgi:hypothetical protein